tara:strand:+ start:1218 stop:1541 length:324 start_codon:yes stop_codon:yes gene_type:complete
MVHESHVLHHHHKKKRKKSKSKLISYVDKFVYAGGIFAWIMTMPQVWKIWASKSATGVSMFTWLTFAILSVLWVFYGILHKDKRIIFIYTGFVILDTFIVVGTLLYG